jgi:hypothetical protein
MSSTSSELELLLRLALDHDTCTTEKARMDGDAVLIPFDCYNPDRDPAWTVEYERVRNRAELLDAFGYG